MSDRLFNRLPDAAVGPVFDMLREQLEGGRDYVPQPAAPDPHAALREHLRTLTPQQAEALYKSQVRKLAAQPVPRSQDLMRSLGMGGMHPAAATANRYMRSLGR